MNGYFTQRNSPSPQALRYEVPREVRFRLWAILESQFPVPMEVHQFLESLQRVFRRLYGLLTSAPPNTPRVSTHAVLEHLIYCSDAQVMDFLEACFTVNHWCGGQSTVDSINAVFQEVGIGYRLTDYEMPDMPVGGVRYGGSSSEFKPPQIVLVENQLVHQEVIVPVLSLLSKPQFEVANGEFMGALADHRAGRHAEAITKTCAAFESVLKTICTERGWEYDPERATCADLVELCRSNDLFDGFYVEPLKAVGTIRNKLGTVHGRGPAPIRTAQPENAEHLLSMTAAHIRLLCHRSGLE